MSFDISLQKIAIFHTNCSCEAHRQGPWTSCYEIWATVWNSATYPFYWKYKTPVQDMTTSFARRAWLAGLNIQSPCIKVTRNLDEIAYVPFLEDHEVNSQAVNKHDTALTKFILVHLCHSPFPQHFERTPRLSPSNSSLTNHPCPDTWMLHGSLSGSKTSPKVWWFAGISDSPTILHIPSAQSPIYENFLKKKTHISIGLQKRHISS